MNRLFTFLKTTTPIVLAFININLFAQISETWNLDSLDFMEGHTVTVNGDPVVVSTDSGPAIEFNGSPDQLIVDANPIGTATKFTVEMIFKPVLTAEEPRVIHIGDPLGQGERVMMEIRISGDTSWYLDGYLNTDEADLTLIDASLTHPLNQWAHVAVTYSNDTFRTFVNGVPELKGFVTYTTKILDVTDKTSIGSRMDSRNYFSGQIRTLKVTQEALSPDKFLGYGSTNPASTIEVKNQNQFRIFPNPARDIVNIEIDAAKSSEVIFAVYDILGSQTMQIKHAVSKGSNKLKINISHLNEGIYFLVQTNNPKPMMLRVIH